MATDITFDDAQKLYSLYNPLLTNDDLDNRIASIIGEKVNFRSYKTSPRKICNDIILKYYPNETVIKSSFINKILLRRGSHVSIFEFSVGNSRVDLCKINGVSIAYEIKTDLDNLQRLSKQLTDYMQVFDKVYLICSEHKIDNANIQIPNNCGIYTYKQNKSGTYSFNLFREAKLSNVISPLKQLKILTKQELYKNFHHEANISKDELILYIASEYSNDYINRLFKKILKNKYMKQWFFLKSHHDEIYDIDYQWFFKYTINPELIYK